MGRRLAISTEGDWKTMIDRQQRYTAKGAVQLVPAATQSRKGRYDECTSTPHFAKGKAMNRYNRKGEHKLQRCRSIGTTTKQSKKQLTSIGTLFPCPVPNTLTIVPHQKPIYQGTKLLQLLPQNQVSRQPQDTMTRKRHNTPTNQQLFNNKPPSTAGTVSGNTYAQVLTSQQMPSPHNNQKY